MIIMESRKPYPIFVHHVYVNIIVYENIHNFQMIILWRENQRWATIVISGKENIIPYKLVTTRYYAQYNCFQISKIYLWFKENHFTDTVEKNFDVV